MNTNNHSSHPVGPAHPIPIASATSQDQEPPSLCGESIPTLPSVSLPGRVYSYKPTFRRPVSNEEDLEVRYHFSNENDDGNQRLFSWLEDTVGDAVSHASQVTAIHPNISLSGIWTNITFDMTFEHEFEHDHADRLTVIQANNDGSKLLTASIDHKITIYDLSQSGVKHKVVDKFTAHDADIRDAKWLHPSTGTQFATIANDLQLRIWQEDSFQAPNSGRRFRRIATIPSSPRVPFVSLSTKTINNTTYIAVIDRQGLLSVFEPTNPDEYNDWTLVDQFNVCSPPPSRGENTSFRIAFDPNPTPLPFLTYMSDDRAQLSIAVTSMNGVKIYRSASNIGNMTPEEQQRSSGSSPMDIGVESNASHRLMFFEACRLPTHPAMVRNLAWAPNNVRGIDTIATCSRDGSVRAFEVEVGPSPTHPNPREVGNVLSTTSSSLSQSAQPQQQQQQSAQPQSTLTSAFANSSTGGIAAAASAVAGTAAAAAEFPTSNQASRSVNPFPYIHTVKLLAMIRSAHNDAWSVNWDPTGQLLMTGGADGSNKIWRRRTGGVSSGSEGEEEGEGKVKFLLFADTAISTGSDEDSISSGSESESK